MKKINVIYLILILTVLFLSILQNDRLSAIFVAFFGIIYTILIGERKYLGYFFGIISVLFGIYLTYTLSLWANCFLHAFYYVPNMVYGILNWKKNTYKENRVKIEKKVEKKDLLSGIFGIIILYYPLYITLKNANDPMPDIEALITVFSLLAMYYSSRRYTISWLLWTLINTASIFLWFIMFIRGEAVFSMFYTRIIYLILGIYFYHKWKEEE